MMQSQITFDSLVVGLSKYLQADEKYPYPPLLQHCCNALAGEMKNYPKTWGGFLALLEQPLKEWWPFDVPNGFDSDFGLTYEGEFTEEANHYFYEELLERDGTLKNLNRDNLENRQFQRLMERLRSADYGVEAQRDYVLLRSFLIESADTTRADIRTTFAGRKITPFDVSEIYEDCGPRDGWTCDLCGPLRERRGQPRGLRPSACDDHGIDRPYVHRVSEKPGRCRVRTGIQLRTTLPGLPEMSLFHVLEALREKYSSQIHAVYLWPGLDRYDLRVEFCSGMAWAADVKDHRKPDCLAKTLTPLYGEGSLRYDKAFYVFPLRRLQAQLNYVKIVQEEAPMLPGNHFLLSETEFVEAVAAEARRLQTQGKKEGAK